MRFNLENGKVIHFGKNESQALLDSQQEAKKLFLWRDFSDDSGELDVHLQCDMAAQTAGVVSVHVQIGLVSLRRKAIVLCVLC